jgi:hypothetical protein
MRACERACVRGGKETTTTLSVPFARRWCGRCARADNDKAAAGMCLAGGTRALLLLALVLCQRAGCVDGKNDNCEYAQSSYCLLSIYLKGRIVTLDEGEMGGLKRDGSHAFTFV